MTTGAERSSRGDDESCGCNSQLCTSYLLGLLACTLVVGGVFLAFHRWDYMWLAVSAVGIILILVGAALHYCGSHGRSKGKRATRRDLGHNEHLLPSAPTLSNTYSVSQLSLNMLPPYFPTYDTMSIATQADGSIAASQIMQINGQSFLLLPLTENMAETQSLANRLSVQLVQSPLEQSNVFTNKIPATTNIIQQSNFPIQPATTPVEQSYSYPLQVNLPQVKNESGNPEVLILSEGHIQTETPAYLSLEPTYESLEPLTEDFANESNEDSQFHPEVCSESMSNAIVRLSNEQINELISSSTLIEESGEPGNEITDSAECEIPIPITVNSLEINGPSDMVAEERPESAIECVLSQQELNIPNASPRSITPEPEQMSSPPPSYDEVAHISLGVYGVAYGTI